MFYDHVHRCVRNALYSINVAVGSTNYEDPKALKALQTQVNDVFAFLRAHAINEEVNIHPFVQKCGAGLERLEEAHAVFGRDIDAMDEKMNAIVRMSPKERAVAGPELYRQLARFIAAYLLHLDDEEYVILPVLMSTFPFDELNSVKMGLIRQIPPGEWPTQIRYQMPAMSAPECLHMLNMLKNAVKVTPQALATIRKAAERAMSPKDWKAAKKVLAPVPAAKPKAKPTKAKAKAKPTKVATKSKSKGSSKLRTKFKGAA